MSKEINVMWGNGCTQTFWTVEEARAEVAYLNSLIAKRQTGRGSKSAAAGSEIGAWTRKAEAIETEIRRVA